MYEAPASKVSRRLVLSLAFILSLCSFGIFGSPALALADDFPVPSGFTLPEQLPYDDGSTVWTHWIAINNSGTSWWVVYHNCDILYWHDTSIQNTSCDDSGAGEFENLTGFSSSTSGTSWGSADIGGFNLGSSYFDVSIGIIGSTDVARNHIFADHTIFSNHTYTADDTRWNDVIPSNFGDMAFNRANFNSDGSLIGVSAPGVAQIVNGSNNSNDYMDVPNPVTDPTGFIGAVFTNFFIFLYKGFVPPDNYFFDKVSEIETTWATDQPGLTAINTAFADGVVSLSTPSALSPVTLGALHIGSATTSTITVFDPDSMDSGMFAQAKTLISAFMYFGVAFWVIRQVSTILSA